MREMVGAYIVAKKLAYRIVLNTHADAPYSCLGTARIAAGFGTEHVLRDLLCTAHLRCDGPFSSQPLLLLLLYYLLGPAAGDAHIESESHAYYTETDGKREQPCSRSWGRMSRNGVRTGQM